MRFINLEFISKLRPSGRLWMIPYLLLIPVAFFAGYQWNKPQSAPAQTEQPYWAAPVIHMPTAVEQAKINRQSPASHSSKKSLEKRRGQRSSSMESSRLNKKFHATHSRRQLDAVAAPSDLVKE